MTRFILALMTSCLFSAAAAETITLLDFTNGKTNGYIGNVNVESVKGSTEGLVVVCKPDIEDPWIEGPALHNWPQGEFSQMYLEIKFKGYGSQSVEIFYGRGFRAEDAVTVKSNNDDTWQTERVMIPKQPDGARLRIDPANRGGGITIESIKLTPVPTLYSFNPTPVTSIDVAADAPKITSGKLVVRHDPKLLCRFDLKMYNRPRKRRIFKNKRRFAAAQSASRAPCLSGRKTRSTPRGMRSSRAARFLNSR